MFQGEYQVTIDCYTEGKPLKEFLQGAKDTLPLVVGAIPFGIVLGTVAATSGLTFAATMAMSLFVFAGASQFVCVSLFAAGTAWPMIVLTTLVINLRHMLYGAAMVPFYKNLNSFWKMILSFGMTDETFAVAIRHYNKGGDHRYKHYYNLGSIFSLYSAWNLSTLAGLTAGTVVPGIADYGLDFAMVATFTGIVIPYLVTKPMWCAVAVSGAVSVVTIGLPHKLGLMVAAIAGVSTGLICELLFAKKENE